jgi:hypothetical protein
MRLNAEIRESFSAAPPTGSEIDAHVESFQTLSTSLIVHFVNVNNKNNKDLGYDYLYVIGNYCENELYSQLFPALLMNTAVITMI